MSNEVPQTGEGAEHGALLDGMLWNFYNGLTAKITALRKVWETTIQLRILYCLKTLLPERNCRTSVLRQPFCHNWKQWTNRPPKWAESTAVRSFCIEVQAQKNRDFNNIVTGLVAEDDCIPPCDTVQ